MWCVDVTSKCICARQLGVDAPPHTTICVWCTRCNLVWQPDVSHDDARVVMSTLQRHRTLAQGMFGNRGTHYLFEFTNLISLLNLTYLFAMLLNLGACLWVWTAYRVGTTSSWMASSPLGDISAGPGTEQYLASLYFTSTTFSTVGACGDGALSAHCGS